MKNLARLLIVMSLFTAVSCNTKLALFNLNEKTADNLDLTSAGGELPASKFQLYQNMSEDEKRQFIVVASDDILKHITGKESQNRIPLSGINTIKTYVDKYAMRQSPKSFDSCEATTFGKSDLGSLLRRGAKVAPAIFGDFKKSKDSVLGLEVLYIGMIEGDFCPCLQAPNGPLGMFQLSASDVEEYNQANNTKFIVKRNSEIDDRCNVEISKKVAAHTLFVLWNDFAADGFNNDDTHLFSIGAYNGDFEKLQNDFQMLRKQKENSKANFWTLYKDNNNYTLKHAAIFLAAAIVGENPHVFGVDIEPLSSYAGSEKIGGQ